MSEKLEFYFKNKIMIFLKKTNGNFYMGLIVEYSDKHLVLLDKKVGQVFVYFSEIDKLEPYKERGENE